MGDMNVTATQSDLANVMTDYSVAPVATDGAGETAETRWTNDKWTQQLGYYKKIPELRSAIDAIARWTIGKGFKANKDDKFTIDTIRGWNKESFNTILGNMIRTYHIGGDAFAEIVRESETGMIINLKPLDPSTITIIANSKGLIKRYEQTSKAKGAKNREIKKEDMFHLSRNRTADEIHGISIVEAVEEIILARNEAMADMRKLMHRHVKPRIVYKLDTDDTTRINAFKTQADKANADGENLYIPKGAVEFEVLSVPTNATLNPLPHIQQLNNYFFQTVGVPQIVVGGSQEITEATAKIAYLSWEQTVEEQQLYNEEQVGMQLGLDIELEFPASLKNEMLSDQSKSETTQAATPEDTNVQGVPLGGA